MGSDACLLYITTYDGHAWPHHNRHPTEDVPLLFFQLDSGRARKDFHTSSTHFCAQLQSTRIGDACEENEFPRLLAYTFSFKY